MPRGPWLDCPGALQHIIARGIERRRIFRSDCDRRDFLDRLETAVSASAWSVYAWCLMPNHVLLLARTGSAPVSDVMQRLLAGYATAFNRRRHRCGHLFQNRFKSILVQGDAHLLELVRYIHSNPLRARMLPDIAALDRYPWTGHAALLGGCTRSWQSADDVLTLFARTRTAARSAYRAFLLDGLDRRGLPDLSGGGLRRSLGGWQPKAQLHRGRERWTSDEHILGDGDFVTEVLAQLEERPCAALEPESTTALRARLDAIAGRFDVAASLIASACKQPRVVLARAAFCRQALNDGRWPAARLATFLGISPMSVHRALRKRAAPWSVIRQEPEWSRRFTADFRFFPGGRRRIVIIVTTRL